jgi:hypothetical protein
MFIKLLQVRWKWEMGGERGGRWVGGEIIDTCEQSCRREELEEKGGGRGRENDY